MAFTSFIPTLWAAAALQGFRPAEVVAQLVNRDYEGNAQSGNKVTINTLSIDDGAASTPVQDYKTGHDSGSGAVPRTHRTDGIASVSQDLLIDQEKAIAFQVQDIDRVQAAGSLEPITAEAAKLLSEDAESYIIGRLTAQGTNDNPDPDGAGSGVPVTVDSAAKAYAAIRTMRMTMTKANVPHGERYMVINPEFLNLLLDESSKLIPVDTSGSPEALREATVGRVLGFTVVESNMLLNSNKPAAVAFHRSAITYANQIQEVEAYRSHSSFADVLRMLHVYGARVTRPTAVRTYLSA